VQSGRNLFAAKFDERNAPGVFEILRTPRTAVGANGRITVPNSETWNGRGGADRDLRLGPGNYVCAEFSDTAAASRPKVCAENFEPFSQRKRTAKHRAWGWRWFMECKRSRGGVAVSSQPDRGHFRADLFAGGKKKNARERTLTPETEAINHPDGGRRGMMLAMGQTVPRLSATACDGEQRAEALEILARGARRDLIITDR